jgi:tRNA G10  N-methylase Trm11
LIKLAKVEPGDIVVDPMCGGGSIPIEGAVAYSQGYHIGGDSHDKAFSRARENVKALQNDGMNLGIDILQWDATRIPLRNNSVDVFVTDLVRLQLC